jgi:S-adenosylmethionine hydrolase
VDVTHDVAPHDVTEGALALEAAAPHFPPGTVHVAVVDPGVGTARRGLALSWRGAVFVGPDNGIFTPFLQEGGWESFDLASGDFARPAVSPTFHGRDVFAPAAARLAGGLDPRRLAAAADPVRLPWPEARDAGGQASGIVIHVDRFGNLITSIPGAVVAGLGPDVAVTVSGRVLPLVATYGDLSEGQAGALVGSNRRLEIAVRERRADVALGLERGAAVVVRRSKTSLPASRQLPPGQASRC